jgi:predicted dehydrogenase
MSDVIKEITIVRRGILDWGNVTEKKKCSPKKHRFLDAVNRTAKAQDYANRHDIIKYYTDADAFINDPDIDATYEALK